MTFVLDEGIKKAAEVARLLREARGDQPPVDVVDESDTDEEEIDETEEAADGTVAARPGMEPA